MDKSLLTLKLVHENSTTNIESKGVDYIKHVQVYMSAQKGNEFELCHITYTYVAQIITCSYVHVWRTLEKKNTTFVHG